MACALKVMRRGIEASSSPFLESGGRSRRASVTSQPSPTMSVYQGVRHPYNLEFWIFKKLIKSPFPLYRCVGHVKPKPAASSEPACFRSGERFMKSLVSDLR